MFFDNAGVELAHFFSIGPSANFHYYPSANLANFWSWANIYGSSEFQCNLYAVYIGKNQNSIIMN